jgi:hypothetical protein
MGNFNIKSVLLGIGIGIIITATVSIIYVSGRDPMKELTKQQIINQAEKYGMVNAPVLQDDTASESTTIFKVQTSEEK